MSGPKVIGLNPQKELKFDLKRTEQSEQKLTITNIHSGNIAFKVKTTAPKAYLVRPSNELLRKGESVDIQILLQPAFAQKDLPHRFLVQAVGCGDANLSKAEWSALKKDEIYEQRLTVVDTPSGGSGGGGAVGSPSDNVAAGDLQTKYEELVEYVLKLEKETEGLEKKRNALKAKVGPSTGLGLQLWHIVAAVAIVTPLVNQFLPGI